MDVSVAQLSDLHMSVTHGAPIFGRDPGRMLCRVMEAWPRRPDVVVLTGDIADDGSRASYQEVADLTEGFAEIRIAIAGNHDDRDALGQVFGSVRPTTLTAISERWAIATIDSSRPGHIGGAAPLEAANELETAIAADLRSVLAFVHHPLVPPCNHKDCGLLDAEALATMVERSGISVLASGHLHEPFTRLTETTLHLGAPSTCVAFRHGGQPHWTATDDPIGGLAFELHDDGTFDHQVVTVAGS